MTYSPCILIPIYNHSATIASTVESLCRHHLPILIVNDGSDASTVMVLEQIARCKPLVTLLHLEKNQGKGGAVMAGFKHAAQLGHSHAIQVDADGQHELNDVSKLLALAKQHPLALISGQPVYDASVPKHRYLARYLTHVWVWIETLSLTIKDSMCGFRVYPLASCLSVMSQCNMGRRMDFDTEIMVRLYWFGVQVIFMPTQVVYPENGISHFRGIEDNARISWMHTRLFFGMLKRTPRLLHRKPKHWSEKKEPGAVSAMLLLFTVYRCLGRRVFSALLHLVIVYYLFTKPSTRKVSQAYWQRLLKTKGINKAQLPQAGWWQVYKHLLSFGEAMLDKLAVWTGDIQLKDLNISGEDALRSALQTGKGAVLFTSHFGNTEICRALGNQIPEIKKINALVFNKHAAKFAQTLKTINPNADINLVHIEEINMATSILLSEMIDRGELVVIAADRTPVGSAQRVIAQPFLGEAANFAEGPFILASILQCPTFLLFCARNGQQFDVCFEVFAEQINLPRKDRAAALQHYISQFSQALESWVIRYPYQWFNFFDFWQKSKANKSE